MIYGTRIVFQWIPASVTFVSSSQLQGVCYPRTVLLITPSFVIARAEKPVAIHCDREKEEKGHVMSNWYASIACSGLPRRSLWFPPRNDTGMGVVLKVSNR